jgi:uncharacterized FAD-dependent dehydrogenase
VAYGATPDILVEAHPHIGTNKFQIIQDIRENYRMWRQVLFETRVMDIVVMKFNRDPKRRYDFNIK